MQGRFLISPLKVALLAISFLFLAVLPACASERVAVHLNPDEFKEEVKTMDPEVLTLALNAYKDAYLEGHVQKPYLAVIDYSKPSYKRRLWILDLNEKKKLYELHVTHGVNSGDIHSTEFSNVYGSLQSSLGVFVTRNPYDGKNGFSLRLDGLEPGVNDNALRRGIVLHGAEYASKDFLRKNGRIGRSWGCPAIDEELSEEVIELLAHGSVIFSYYPDKNWLVSAEHNGSSPV